MLRLTWKTVIHMGYYEFNLKILKIYLGTCILQSLRRRLHVTKIKPVPEWKIFLFTHEVYPRMKKVEFHPWIKFNLKGNLPLITKPYNKTYSFFLNYWDYKVDMLKTSDNHFFQKSNFTHHFHLLIF